MVQADAMDDQLDDVSASSDPNAGAAAPRVQLSSLRELAEWWVRGDGAAGVLLRLSATTSAIIWLIPAVPVVGKAVLAFVIFSAWFAPLIEITAALARSARGFLGRRDLRLGRRARVLALGLALIASTGLATTLVVSRMTEQAAKGVIEAHKAEKERQRAAADRERERAERQEARVLREIEDRETVEARLMRVNRREDRLRTGSLLAGARAEYRKWNSLLARVTGPCPESTAITRNLRADLRAMRHNFGKRPYGGPNRAMRAAVRRWIRWSRRTRKRIGAGASSFSYLRIVRL